MKNIKLPDPQRELDFPLMKALELRRSKRKWAETPIELQELSNLLWAACGITHESTKRSKSKRTAPSATNCQEISVYVALVTGVYLYYEIEHQLIMIKSEDMREHLGTQKMMKSAPVGLIYVSDYSKFKVYLAKDEEKKKTVSGTDTGFISQNVYLYCAAAGLNTVVLGLVDRNKLHTMLGLDEHENVVYTQIVGNAVE
jgi:SagB-type dehydrogenase family enzyme